MAIPIPGTIHRPRLLFPADLVVEQIDRSNTYYDNRSREPVGNVKRTQVTIEAQRSNVHRQIPVFTQYGVDEQVRGWFTIRKEDADKLSYTPKRGDRLIKFGDQTIELYVVNTEPQGHYEAGYTLWRLYFTDRRPAATNPDKGN